MKNTIDIFKTAIFGLLVTTFIFAKPLPVHAGGGQIRLRLATIAPDGTSYHVALQRMANEWQKVSNGRVRTTIFPGGIQGGEAAMVQRMRLESLDAALITANGIAKIVPEVEGMQSIPMMFRSLDEVEYINEKLGDRIAKMLEEKGVKVLFWADAGWVKFFSKTPVATPDDLKKLKLFTWAGSPDAEKLARDVGLQPVPMETAEILTGLKTGYIEAVSMPLFAANANQIYREAPYLLDVNWAPLVGACVINKSAWDEIPADLQKELLAKAEETGKIIKALSRREAAQAKETMSDRWGLKIQDATPEIQKQWEEFAKDAYPLIRGKLVPEDVFDEVEKLLKEYRAANP